MDGLKTVQLTSDEALLAQLGYRQQFKRQFTIFETFGVAFSIIGLVPSIASVLTFAIPNGGPVSMVWGWGVASIFIFVIGLAMAELGSAAPTSGGLYYWTHRYSSPRTRNLLSWIVGYANTIGLISGVTSISYGTSLQIMACATVGSGLAFSPTTEQTFGVFAGLVLMTGLVASLGTRVLARLQNVYVVSNILLIFALIISIAVATPSESRNSAKFALGNFQNLNGWPDGFAFIIGFLAPLWTISGFDSCVHISEEASNASRAVPLGIISSIGLSGILGVAVNIALAFCMGTDLDSIVNNPIGQPMVTILNNSLGSNGVLAIFGCIVVVQFMMATSILIASSRQSFAFARDGALPFSSYLSRVNHYTQTPLNAVWFGTTIALLLGLLVFAGDTAVNAVFSLGVVAQYIAYCIPITARVVFKNDFVPGPFSLGIWSKPVAFLASAWMILITVVFMFPSTPHPDSSSMNYVVVVIGGWILLSLVWYYFPKYGGVYWFKGPVANVRAERPEEADSSIQHDRSSVEKEDSIKEIERI